MSRGNLVTFKDSLKALFISRLNLIKKGEEVNFISDGGVALYGDVLEEICKTISEIKQKFPEKVNKCALFASVENELWREEFKKNFYKIFIDRLYCKSDGDVPHLQFNKTSLEGNSQGADLCYAEGFALGFLEMLSKVQKQFEKADAANIAEKDFLNLLINFNKIVTGSEDNIVANVGRSFGAVATYQDIARRKAAQNKYGGNQIYYDFTSCEFVIELDENFDHPASCSLNYKEYLNALKFGTNGEDAVFKMTVLIPSCAHLCVDGNARSANLFGWMAAILHNTNYPIAINPYFLANEIILEAKEWTRNFMQSPGRTESLSTKSEDLYKGLLTENLGSAETHHLTAIFLTSLLQRSEGLSVFFEIPFATDMTLCAGKSLDIEDSFIITNNRDHQFDGEEKINLADLTKIIKSHQEELIAEKDLEKRNAKIAFYFLQHAANGWDRYKTEESRNVVSFIVKGCEEENFKDETMRAKYEAMQKICCENLLPYLKVNRPAGVVGKTTASCLREARGNSA